MTLIEIVSSNPGVRSFFEIPMVNYSLSSLMSSSRWNLTDEGSRTRHVAKPERRLEYVNAPNCSVCSTQCHHAQDNFTGIIDNTGHRPSSRYQFSLEPSLHRTKGKMAIMILLRINVLFYLSCSIDTRCGVCKGMMCKGWEQVFKEMNWIIGPEHKEAVFKNFLLKSSFKHQCVVWMTTTIKVCKLLNVLIFRTMSEGKYPL